MLFSKKNRDVRMSLSGKKCELCKKLASSCCECCETPLCSRACQRQYHRAVNSEMRISVQDDKNLEWEDRGNYLSNFVVVKPLASGSSGEVFVFQRKDDQQLYAIKFIKSENKFGNDVTMMKLLSAQPSCSRYVVCYYDHGRVRHPVSSAMVPFIVTNYVDGPELGDVRIAPLERRVAIPMLLHSALKALHYLHSNDIVHADIKPENLMVHANTADVVLIDLGLACKRQCERLVGTPMYFAPELLNGSDLPSASSDVFALGAAFFFLSLGSDKEERLTVIKHIDGQVHHNSGRDYTIPWVDEDRYGPMATRESYDVAMQWFRLFTDAANEPYAQVLLGMVEWHRKLRLSAADALRRLEAILEERQSESALGAEFSVGATFRSIDWQPVLQEHASLVIQQTSAIIRKHNTLDVKTKLSGNASKWNVGTAGTNKKMRVQIDALNAALRRLAEELLVQSGSKLDSPDFLGRNNSIEKARAEIERIADGLALFAYKHKPVRSDFAFDDFKQYFRTYAVCLSNNAFTVQKEVMMPSARSTEIMRKSEVECKNVADQLAVLMASGAIRQK